MPTSSPLWWRVGLTLGALVVAALVVGFFTMLVVGKSAESVCFSEVQANRIDMSLFPPQFECIKDATASGAVEVTRRSAASVMGVVGAIDLLILGTVATVTYWATRSDRALGWGGAYPGL